MSLTRQPQEKRVIHLLDKLFMVNTKKPLTKIAKANNMKYKLISRSRAKLAIKLLVYLKIMAIYWSIDATPEVEIDVEVQTVSNEKKDFFNQLRTLSPESSIENFHMTKTHQGKVEDFHLNPELWAIIVMHRRRRVLFKTSHGMFHLQN